MKSPKSLILFLLICLCSYALQAQESSGDKITTKADTMETEEVNVVDIVLQRSLMTGAKNVSELTRIKNTSGSWFVGLGFKIPVVKNKAGFRLTPGLSFVKLNYDSVDIAKTFPDLPGGVDYTFQRHRLTYFQLPLGAYVNFTTDEKGRPQIFGEAGGYLGYRLGGVLRYGEISLRDQQIRTKITNIPDMENLQYGIYGRLGYKNLAICMKYRMTRLFIPFKSDLNDNPTTVRNPIFPRLEIGLSLLL